MFRTRSRARVALIAVLILLLGFRFRELNWLVPLVIWLTAMGGCYEIHNMGHRKGIQGSMVLAFIASTVLMIAALQPAAVFVASVLPIVVLILAGAFLIPMFAAGLEDSYRRIPLNVFTPLYVALPLALGYQVFQYDRFTALFVLTCVWVNDSGAYFTGRAIGRRRLWEALSPGKTWEGAVGGFAAALIAALGFKAIVPAAAFSLTWVDITVLGAVLSIAAQVGDLAESMLKRDAGVKDSGTTYTAHGGVLDRIDSLLFGFAAAYLFLLARGYLSLDLVA